MKISTYHKNKGDTVEWWNPLEEYNIVYSSKIFTYTPENQYLPQNTVRGGTGYNIDIKLPKEIDDLLLDYAIYPQCDYALGFITRGCIRNCKYCVVPRKEGKITPYCEFKNIVRPDTDKIVLMDNNILACDFGIEELVKIAQSSYKIDINQGLDCRLVTPEIAEIISRLKFIKYIRFACDSFRMVWALTKAIRLLEKYGVPQSRIFVYFLVNDIQDAISRVEFLREYPKIHLYGQAYRDFGNGGKPVSKEALDFAQRYIFPQSWIKKDWYDTPIGRKYKK
jgi:hypothetical protein